ncbi:MAG: type I restriction-modification enzyme R subunit C-terminal domain-containing protein [Bacteroidota bacterium]|nr:type I restriction-modification enzyme R subunit C-terminal domain-containing protein [Bacteroidota bacterium]
MKEYGDKPLGVFIRSIVGLDKKAAKEAFAEFLDEGNLTANQIRFINTIIDHFSINGYLNKAMLFESPFTEINDQGMSGLFEKKETDKLIEIISGINHNAEVA